MKEIYEYSTTAADNDFATSDGGMPEGQSRSSVNDAARARMAALKTHYLSPEWINFSVTGPEVADAATFTRVSGTQVTLTLAANDFTQYVGTGRLVLIKDGGGLGTDKIGQVTSSSYANPTTTINVTLNDGTDIDVAATGIWAHSISNLRQQALLDDSSGFYIPNGTTAADINAAIALAAAGNDGIVLLAHGAYSLEAAITITAGVQVLGADAAVNLGQQVAAGISPLITIQNGSSLENVVVAMNGNTGTAISMTGSLSCIFRNFSVSGGTDAIRISNATATGMLIENGILSGYTRHGIASDAVTDTHSGSLDGIAFDGSSTTDAAAAGIKVAGGWAISKIRGSNVGKASGEPRGIWLWNEASNDGGRQSSVTEAIVDAGSGNIAVGIEVGGDRNVVHGNVVNVNSGGTGIYVRTTSAGQSIQGANIQGNVINGGGCIRVNENVDGAIVHGNQCFPASGSQGIVDDGNNSDIKGNYVDGGTQNIRTDSNATGSEIYDNQLRNATTDAVLVDGGSSAFVRKNRIKGSPTNGINVSSGATDTRVIRNYVDSGITNKVTNASTTTREIHNSMDHYVPVWAAYSASDFLGGSTSELAITGLVGLNFPPGANKAYGRWRVWWSIENTGSPSTQTYRIRIGTAGGLSDPVAFTIGPVAGSAFNTTVRFPNVAEGEDEITGDNVYVCTDATELITVSADGASGNSRGRVHYLYFEWVSHE